MNVFQMYEANGNKCGFWIQRDSWGFTIARVVSIAGLIEGPLDGLGKPPYYDKARDLVYAELYSIRRTGDSGITRDFLPSSPVPGHRELTVISCPGTYAYRMLDGPPGPIIEPLHEKWIPDDGYWERRRARNRE